MGHIDDAERVEKMRGGLRVVLRELNSYLNTPEQEREFDFNLFEKDLNDIVKGTFDYENTTFK